MSAQGFGIMDTLKCLVFENGEHATAHGFHYAGNPAVTPVEIVSVVVVRDGTVAGKPTVDLLMEDQDGRQYVVMLTAKLLGGIPYVKDSA